jgi:glutamate-1-semialdehyde 2,1-aminomutase
MGAVYQNAARYAKSKALFKSASEIIPGGVNSTARAVWSGWDPYPLFVEEGTGSHLRDVDGNAYIDYLLGLGPMILGHRPKKVTEAVINAIQKHGTVFALPAAAEIELTRKMIAAVPSLEQVRLCNTGTEAVLYPLRRHVSRLFRRRVLEQASRPQCRGIGWSAGGCAAGARNAERNRRFADHPSVE